MQTLCIAMRGSNVIYSLETGGSVTVTQKGVGGEYVLKNVTKIETERKKHSYEIKEILTNEVKADVSLDNEYRIKLFKLRDRQGFIFENSEFELIIRYENDVDVYSHCKLAAFQNRIAGNDCIEEIYTIKAKRYDHIGGY